MNPPCRSEYCARAHDDEIEIERMFLILVCIEIFQLYNWVDSLCIMHGSP